MTAKKSVPEIVAESDDPKHAAEAAAEALDQLPVEVKPDLKPGDPGYDWSAHYGTDKLYRHTFADGTVVAIKPFVSIYSKTWLYKIRNLETDTDVEFAAIDRASCEAAREVLMNLDDTGGDPLDELWTAWIAAGTSRGDGDEGLTPGKSSG